MEKLIHFNPSQIVTVNNAVAMAEELVSNFYKISDNEWLRPKYDIKTLVDLSPEEIVQGPFAQVIRYVGQRKDSNLSSSTFDFYKVCLQDHSILLAVKRAKRIKLYPFALYIVTHELIHIVRFSKFLQNFEASDEEKMVEESRVHQKTREILSSVRISGLNEVLQYYGQWSNPLEDLSQT
jgi:hypothetical protein